jgi:hypothetical protein
VINRRTTLAHDLGYSNPCDLWHPNCLYPRCATELKPMKPIWSMISSGGMYGTVFYESENRYQRSQGLP